MKCMLTYSGVSVQIPLSYFEIYTHTCTIVWWVETGDKTCIIEIKGENWVVSIQVFLVIFF